MAGSIIITFWSLKKEKNLWVRCTLCAPSQKTLLRARNTLSNFKKHLDTVHKATKLVAKEPAKVKQSKDSAEDHDGTPRAKRQCMPLNKPAISLIKLRSLTSEYIVEDMLPLSTADSPVFRKLIGGVYSTQVPGRKAVTLHLDKVFVTMEPKLKRILEWVDFVGKTADVWKSCNRGFFGVTAHWIDPTTL